MLRKLYNSTLKFVRVVASTAWVIIRWPVYALGVLAAVALLGVCFADSGATPMYDDWSVFILVLLAVAVFLAICFGGPALYRYLQAKARVNVGKRLIGRHL